ncbi:MAG: hypothetical protein Q3993_04395 [Filifactor alocis]|nr:hypothetical protein [Filifactor alocis]
MSKELRENTSYRVESDEQRSLTRRENIVWTIAEDYEISPDFSLIKDTKIESLDFIRIVLFATLYKEGIGHRVQDHLLKLKNRVEAYEIVSEIFALTMEIRQMRRWEKARPVLLFYYKRAQRATLETYQKRKPKDITQELRNALYLLREKKIPKTRSNVRELAQRIEEMGNFDIEKWFDFLEGILEDFFHFNREFRYYVDEKRKVEHVGDIPLSRTSTRAKKSGVSREEIVSIASAEFNPNDFGDKESKAFEKDMQEDSLSSSSFQYDRMHSEIVKYYGSSVFSPNELARIQKDLCTGLHQNCRLHFTKTFMKIADSYRLDKLKEVREENLEHYQHHQRLYRRNILRLKETIERAILPDMQESLGRSDEGRLIAPKVWRYRYLNDKKVFCKSRKDARGEFVVDLFLDSSGSQMERESLVAAQAFIIAEALSLCHIPVRIMSFQTLFDYTILKEYRGYYSEKSSNKEVFYYKSEGSNRDGLALRFLDHLIKQKDEKKHIVLILSDGRPSDIRGSKLSSVFVSNVKNYSGQEAVYDTAFEVRKLRKKGIAVLGVFTGKEEDRVAEQLIFSKDFAYIHDIKRFSDVVGKYLKIQIKNHLE